MEPKEGKGGTGTESRGCMLFHFSSFPSQCGVQRMGESPSQPELSAIKCFKPETNRNKRP